GKNPRLYQAIGKTWKLTVEERKRILLNNIYGVDIDFQAVEVTKLSLLLKVLEDEQSVISQLSLLKERVLPDIDSNIKCGNSLIGDEFYQEKQLELIDEETQYRVNAFDWKNEFAEAMQAGGFDAVIGNPPYVRQELLSESKNYFQNHYRTYHGVADLYVYFIEKGIALLNENGQFGIIVANKWMRANYAQPLRQWLKQQCLIEIVDFGDLPVFQQATTYPCILRIQRAFPQSTFQVVQIKTLDFEDLKIEVAKNAYTIQVASLNDKSWSLANKKTQALLEKLHNKGVPLSEYVNGKIFYGIKTGFNKAFVIDTKTRDKLIACDAKSEELIKPFLLGRDIKRYQSLSIERYLILIPKGWTRLKSQSTKNAWAWLKRNYPSIATHLQMFSKNAQKRYDQGEYWWELRGCDYYDEFKKTKIIYPNICQRPEFSFDKEGYYANQKCFIIPIADEYLLGILNSSVSFFLFRFILPKLRGNFYEPSYVYLKNFPIRLIDFNNPTDKANHDKIVKLAEQMLTLNKKRRTDNDIQTQTVLERRIKATDKQINQLVYTLYDLTAKEIEIVEKGD
ncbi:TaqI-like C-terminal specificity domain-containing protein, partial [Candidatus Parabeggiatoa sp. HSG14]|uniref:Eco57I restriction-modification methylase domain-containing protein n=1 Tax=Candidatus Parabeggiatoa sp. HSG14 TaxID=3055593 RepID=UPI0025A7F92A|nr:TaqI-like C-terminal specificity domain-containing protein [Thiotrichales bacterium HSG14]